MNADALSRFAGSKSALGLSLALVAFVFVWVRLQFWLDPIVPQVVYDSETYFAVAFDIADGQWPLFDLRTPGYPLFLATMLGLFGTLRAVFYAQQALTLVAGLALLGAVYAVRRELVLLATIPVLGIVGSNQTFWYETCVMTESVYTGLLVCIVAALIVGFGRRSGRWLAVASAGMGMMVLLRPAGLFLVGTYALILPAIWYLRLGWRTAGMFAVPMPLLLGALATYNLATLGHFTVSPFGGANLIAATATFWREIPGFPEPVNRAVREVQASVSPAERKTLAHGWNPWELGTVFEHHYQSSGWETLVPALDAMGLTGIKAQMPYFSQLNRAAITDQPLLYAKFVYSSLIRLLRAVEVYRPPIPPSTQSYARIYVPGNFLRKLAPQWRGYLPAYANDPQRLAALRAYALREYSDVKPLPNFRAELDDALWSGARVVMVPTATTNLAEWFGANIYSRVFIGRAWHLSLVLSLLVAPVVLFRSPAPRARAIAALILVLALSMLGALLLVALVEVGLWRYAHPTQFIYYLAPVLLLWMALEMRPRPATASPGPDPDAQTR